jgi:hypothetical protein
MVGEAARATAQRDLDMLGNGCEIGLTVKRGKDGAAHESSAAEAGQDRAAEPLNRDPATIDLAAGPPVDGKRRLVAELKTLRLEVPKRGRPMTVFQD